MKFGGQGDRGTALIFTPQTDQHERLGQAEVYSQTCLLIHGHGWEDQT